MDPGTFIYPVSSMLARVLAEAASGFINEGQVYFVASYQPLADQPGGPFDVHGPYATFGDAVPEWLVLNGEEIIEGEAPSYGIFGPFDTTVALRAANGQADVTKFADVHTSADTKFPIDPADQYDAIFYSAAAVLKFAVPYYTRVYGPEFGQRVIDRFQESDLAMMVHLPWTEYTELSTKGQRDTVLFFDRHGGVHTP